MIACIYHGGCPDGFGAAWALRHRFPEEEILYYPSAYGAPLPDFDGRRPDATYVLDFSWPFEQMLILAGRSNTTLLIDHHQTALDDFAEHRPALVLQNGGFVEDGLWAELDMDRSGAMMTWEHLHDEEPPALLRYIQDRDLWRWELEESRKVGSLILALDQDFELWDHYMGVDASVLRALGSGAAAFEEAVVRSLVPKAHWCGVYVGFGERRIFPIVNAPYIVGSTLAERLMDHFDWDMAGYWLVNADGSYQYGVRSRRGVTVHEFAKALGGGGHKQAAGFRDQFSPLHSRLLGSGTFELPREGS